MTHFFNPDTYAATADASASGPPVRVRLKWFNVPKGFGFVVPEDEPDLDAFLHITTLQRGGVSVLDEGARLICTIQRGQKGAHVTQVIEILDGGTDDGQSVRPPRGTIPGKPCRMGGTVKWYKAEKGFGFIVPDDGMKDVFIHKTCLESLGIDQLEAGERVIMTFRVVPKGREVESLTFEDKF